MIARWSSPEGRGSLSPDMHWIAYESNESGRNEIYVRPFVPQGPLEAALGEGKWQDICAENDPHVLWGRMPMPGKLMDCIRSCNA
jgi:hypothetical protein